MATKVVYATADLTVHRVLGQEQLNGNTVYNVESVVLSYGDTLPLDSLPPYQQEAIEAGRVAGAEVLTETQAAKKKSDWEAAMGGPRTLVYDAPAVLLGPDADDGSHSDHLVPDDVRSANLAAMSAPAPTTDGRKTRRTVAGAAEAEEGQLVGENGQPVDGGPVTDSENK